VFRVLVTGDVGQGDVVFFLPAENRDGASFDFDGRLAVLGRESSYSADRFVRTLAAGDVVKA
jgi:hypothetical protein